MKFDLSKRFHLSRELPFTGVKLDTIQETPSGIHIAQPLVFEKVEPGVYDGARAPMLHVTDDEAQQLMDELWRVGLRPSEGTGSAGAMAATQAHLDDMRAQNTKLLDALLAKL